MAHRGCSDRETSRPTRIGINGFGRIGRVLARQILEHEELELVAIAEICDDVENLAYLFNFDSNYGRAKVRASVVPSRTAIDFGHSVARVFGGPNIDDVPWSELGVEVLIDSSGVESNVERASLVLKNGGVHRYIVTHSPNAYVEKWLVLGVNDDELDTSRHRIVSTSICDVNAMAHIFKAIDSGFGIESGFVTTLHPWLSYQNLTDKPLVGGSSLKHPWSDYSLGRASPGAIIPKNTTAISALSQVLPKLAGKLTGFSYRTPNALVCSADLTLLLSRDASADSINRHLQAYFMNSAYVKLNTESLTSKDYEGDPASVIIDLQWTRMAGSRLAKLVGWYDNEWGYCARVTELILRFRQDILSRPSETAGDTGGSTLMNGR